MAVGGGEVEPALVHGHAAVADVFALGGAVIVPDLVAGAGVDGPNVVGHREVEDAIDQQRRRFDSRVLMRLEHPREAEIGHVLRRDLLERGVAAAGIVAVIERPGVGRRVLDLIGLEVLRMQGRRPRTEWRRERSSSSRLVVSHPRTECIQNGAPYCFAAITTFFNPWERAVRASPIARSAGTSSGCERRRRSTWEAARRARRPATSPCTSRCAWTTSGRCRSRHAGRW